MEETIFVVGIHGDEQTPIKVAKALFGKKPTYLVANPGAVKKNVRFLETDLNRSFPGNIRGSREEKVAIGILKRLRGKKRIIDFHTSTCQTPPFVILTKLSLSHLELTDRIAIKRVIYMEKSIASGRALIDHVSTGVSIECGYDKSKTMVDKINKILEAYLKKEKHLTNKEYFSVFEILIKKNKKEKLFKNIRAFKLVKKGVGLSKIGKEVIKAPFSFYPILPREKSYKDVLCLAAKKITKKDLLAGEKGGKQ